MVLSQPLNLLLLLFIAEILSSARRRAVGCEESVLSCKLGVLLLPGFSLLSYASLVEPLRVCNELLDERKYRLVRLGAEPVVTSGDGVAVSVDRSLAHAAGLDALVVCGSVGLYKTPLLEKEWLSTHGKSLSWLGGVANGAALLLELGLLRGKKASLQIPDAFSAQAQACFLSQDVFSVDANIWTCRGGTAALDMALFMIGRHHGVELAEMASQAIMRERLGGAKTTGRKRPDLVAKREAPALCDAVQLMENNIEEPLTTDDIAKHLEISRRQLERLFKRYLDSVPSRYYLQIRLEKARDMLCSSALSITEIGLKTGFSSGAHFSTAYRNLYGLTPSEERAGQP